jgi:hypothetical protein
MTDHIVPDYRIGLSFQYGHIPKPPLLEVQVFVKDATVLQAH